MQGGGGEGGGGEREYPHVESSQNIGDREQTYTSLRAKLVSGRGKKNGCSCSEFKGPLCGIYADLVT